MHARSVLRFWFHRSSFSFHFCLHLSPALAVRLLPLVFLLVFSWQAEAIKRKAKGAAAPKPAEAVHVLVLLAAGFVLCFGESINLT
jgi:hypothetical protein